MKFGLLFHKRGFFGICSLLLLLGKTAFAVPPLLGVQGITAGSFHTCAIVNGSAQCWGDNANGQLGNGTKNPASTPAEVAGLHANVSAISSGYRHACAVASGAALCWGWNPDGELGNGTMTQSMAPVGVTGLSSGVTAIAAGANHSCAIVSGAVWCWGYNSSGQLGNGTAASPNLTPVNVTGLGLGVSTITSGFDHTCAIVSGGAWCWGGNSFGQLGNGTHSGGATPVAVNGLSSGVSAISAGDDLTCAVVNGGAQCWGDSGFGALGNGTTFSGSPTPVSVNGLNSGVTAIVAGIGYACAAVSNNSAHPVKCWGYNNYGELGNGSATSSSIPVDAIFFPPLAAGDAVVSLAEGGFHTCAEIVSMTGVARMQCWGENKSGELGVAGPPVQNPMPATVVGISASISGMNSGGSYNKHACVVVSGAAKCWGSNSYGQLGNNLLIDSSVAQSVVGLGSGVTAITTGAQHTCAVVNAAAQCWGANESGETGTTYDSIIPVLVTGLSSGVTAISGGPGGTCAIVNGGEQCWGNGTPNPAVVTGLSSGVTAIAEGGLHRCAIVAGGMQCWGGNSSGQLGNGSTTNSGIPVGVSGLSANVTAITTGISNSCAVVNGGAQCWGDNTYGQLGVGATSGSSTPKAVVGLGSGVIAIVTGGDNFEQHACAIVNGGVKCWGSNLYGQLGDGTFNSSNAPVAVVGLSSGVIALGTGSSHTCALLGNGMEKCWGDDHYGQLGDGRFLSAETPQAVVAGDPIFHNGFEGN